MDYWTQVLKVIHRYKPLGYRKLTDGTQLIGHVPHVGSEAWLHAIFASLGNSEISKLEKKVEIPFPKVFHNFLKRANGSHLFIACLSIDGFRRSNARVGDEQWQPFNIVTPNTLERPSDAKDSYLFIGGYSWDGSRLFIDLDNNQVFRCPQMSCEPLNSWPGFEEMLLSEVMRISELFDESGRQIDEEQPTTP